MSNLNYDPKGRDRTDADRKAFTLSESAIAMGKLLSEQNAPKAPEPLPTDKIVDPNWAKSRERMLARESVQAARRDAFLRVLGEVTYRALPLDEHEKAPYRDAVLEQAGDFAKSLIESWELTAVGQELLETVNGVMTGESVEAAVQVFEEALKEGELAPMVEHLGSEIERRVVEAVVTVRERAAAVEARLAEATAESSGDPELDALRARRATKRAAPSLMEALYVANRRTLTEDASREVAPEVVMVEAVCQYAMMECMSSIGVMSIERADVDVLARRLTARKD